MQRRLPENTELHALDVDFENLLVQAVENLVKATNRRRCRRVAGLLGEFAELSQDAVLIEYYRRVIGETFLDAVAQR